MLDIKQKNSRRRVRSSDDFANLSKEVIEAAFEHEEAVLKKAGGDSSPACVFMLLY